jgi:hypothetical protein
MPYRIKLMWDYHCWPLWHFGDDGVGNIDPDSLPLSADTKTRLETWAAIPDAKLAEHISAPQDITWSDEEMKSFETEGLELWKILRLELGPDFLVIYHSMSTGNDLLPENDSSV